MAAGRPGDAFAIGNDEQYRPVRAVGGQRVPVGGPEGTGRLACHASRPLRGPRRGPVLVVSLAEGADRVAAAGWLGVLRAHQSRVEEALALLRPAARGQIGVEHTADFAQPAWRDRAADPGRPPPGQLAVSTGRQLSSAAARTDSVSHHASSSS